MSKIATLRQVASAVPSGAFVAVGGFQLNRPPIALLGEMIRAGVRDLRVVCAPNPLALDILVGSDAVREAECGFIGFEYEGGFVIAPATQRAVQEAGLALVDRDVYETIQSLRAGMMGVSFLPLDYPEPLEPTGTGDKPSVAGALRPEFALIHAQEVDRDGNLRIDDPHADLILAGASDSVLATAERLVERIAEPSIPARRVAHAAVCPGGAAPGGCFGWYPRDPASIGDYLAAIKSGDLPEYLDGLRKQPASVDEKKGIGRPRRVDAAPAETPAPTVAAPREEQPADGAAPSLADLLVVLMARQVSDGDVVATGLASALAMMAIELARRTHAPELRYLNCVGAVDPRIPAPLPTSVDADLLHDCAETMPLPELFDAACKGEVDLMFFGGAQVDRRGRINLSRIGTGPRPRVKLAGPAGSPSMRSFVRKVVVTVPRQSTRNLVEEVDFATSLPSKRNSQTTLITDLGVWTLRDGNLEPESAHPGVSPELFADRTGFPVSLDAESITRAPTPQELEQLVRLDPFGVRHRLIGGAADKKKKEQEPVAT